MLELMREIAVNPERLQVSLWPTTASSVYGPVQMRAEEEEEFEDEDFLDEEEDDGLDDDEDEDFLDDEEDEDFELDDEDEEVEEDLLEDEDEDEV